MNNGLQTTVEAAKRIEAGAALLLAGAESALDALPHGKWIAGTIPYFMAESGGVEDTERVFVTEVPDGVVDAAWAVYDVAAIDRIALDGPSHGFTAVIVPAFSAVHRKFAQDAPEFKDMFIKPIVGWVSGVAVEDIGRLSPKVYFGQTGEKLADAAVALHAALAPEFSAKVDIVNLFHQGRGPALQFESQGFLATDCLIDGCRANLARYIAGDRVDTRLPLVADFCGAMINTSISAVDADTGETTFYAPVFPGVVYRFADSIVDYATEFERQVPKGVEMVFSCNCILNYLYGELEGKPLAGTAGPITFGEIAYQLLNQTMVYLELVPADPDAQSSK